MLAGVLARVHPRILHVLTQPRLGHSERGDPVDDVHDEPVAIEVVHHHHVERRCRGALLLEPAHVDVAVSGAAIGEAMNQPRVAVVGEHDRLVGRENRVEHIRGQAMRMLGGILQPHQVDHVDDPHLEVGESLAQDLGRRHGLERRDVSGACQHDVRLFARDFGARPVPDTEPSGAVRDRLVHIEPVGRGLLARDDHVYVVDRTEAVVVGGEKGVGVGRKVDAHHIGLLVDHVVDEAGILMAEPVVVLPPDVRREQVIERGDRPAPRDLTTHLEPLGVLIHHRIDDVDERLVAVEHPVPAGQQVALEPPLTLVLRQHLHYAASSCEVLVDRPDGTVPLLVGRLVHRLEAIRGGLVRAEDTKVVGIPTDDVGEPLSEFLRRLPGRRSGLGDVDRVVAEVGQVEFATQNAPVRVRRSTHPQFADRRERAHEIDGRARFGEQLFGPVRLHPALE